MAAGRALANVNFYPPEKKTPGFTQSSTFCSQREASCSPARLGTVPWLSPGVSQGALPGEGLGVILPWQGHTAEHTLALPMLLPQKIKLNHWPPTNLEQSFSPSQQFKSHKEAEL